MITIFSVPKPFQGHINIIQTNAIESWVRLTSPSKIILFGDELGVSEKAAQYKLKHIPEISRNEYGTPLLNSVFEKTQMLSTSSFLCYVNADIILMSDFNRAFERLLLPVSKQFLLAGRRWDIDLSEPLDFADSNWERLLLDRVRTRGRQRSPEWIDYFVFPRDLYANLPPFAIGRPVFDNWLLWKARSLGARLLDASEVIMAIHQNHGYSHIPQGEKDTWEGPEARCNRELMGTWRHCYYLSDATDVLTRSGLKRNLTMARFIRLLQLTKITLIEWVRVPLHWLGLCRSTEERFRN
jgi:hypothetical protein